MRIRTFALLLAFVAAAPAAAQGPGTYRSESGFVLDLPAGWVRAPESAVEEVRSASRQPALTFEAVFQAGGTRWPEPPFAAIAVGPTPRWLTPEEFRRRWTADDAQTELQRRANRADTLQAGRVDARVGVPRWDPDTRAAWLRTEMGATGGVSWSAFMLHPSGRAMIILQHYGAPGTDEEQVREELRGVVRSLRAG